MIGSFRSLLLLLLAILVSLVDSQFNSVRNFWPASYPLAVRAPYLNTWINTANGSDSLNFWPLHWDGSNVRYNYLLFERFSQRYFTDHGLVGLCTNRWRNLAMDGTVTNRQQHSPTKFRNYTNLHQILRPRRFCVVQLDFP